MEELQSSSLFNTKVQYSKEMVELIQRLLRLKNRFKVVVPENLLALRQRIQSLDVGGKPGDGTGFDLFYRVGNIFTQHQGPLSMGELSHGLEVQLSTATRTVDWLVSNGYARRLSDTKDRRIVRVELTEAGVDVYRTIHEFFMERLKRFMQRFTLEERDAFLALLRKVVEALEQGI
jgi:DNA-binding MarR family transcriptional regulator